MITVRRAEGAHLLPAHRLFAVAKTPVLVVLGGYLAGARGDNGMVAAVVVASAAGVLWMSLYAINEASDLILERGIRLETRFLAAPAAVVIIACAVGIYISPGVGFCFLLMCASQLCYCLPPIRAKRWWWMVLIASGIVNPTLRLQCGVLLGRHGLPISIYVVLILIHLGGALRTRCLLRERDRALSYRAAPGGAEWFGWLSTGAGIVWALWMCAKGALPPAPVLAMTPGAAFAAYAWSGRVRAVAQLRRAWLWFAVCSGAFVVLLMTSR